MLLTLSVFLRPGTSPRVSLQLVLSAWVATVTPETAFDDPHSLTDRELAQFGIKRVPDRASINRTVGGTEVTPGFIATSCPLTVCFSGAQRIEEGTDGNEISRTEIETENTEIIS